MSADRPFRFTHRWAVPADARSVLALQGIDEEYLEDD